MGQISNNFQDACGWFLHCVVQLVFRASQIYTDPETDLAHHPCFRRLSSFLSDSTKHHAAADIGIDFDLTKDAEYSHMSIEGEANLAKVEHLKNVYESLIEYCILNGGAEGKEDYSSAIIGLYIRYMELNQLAKVSSKFKANTFLYFG